MILDPDLDLDIPSGMSFSLVNCHFQPVLRRVGVPRDFPRKDFILFLILLISKFSFFRAYGEFHYVAYKIFNSSKVRNVQYKTWLPVGL